MTSPLPSDSNVPLVQGMDPSWNSVFSHVPEDKRSEVADFIRKQNSEYDALKKTYEPWDGIVKSGIDPSLAETGINVLTVLENNPQQVYDALSTHLGITKKEAKEMVEEVEETGEIDITQHPQFLQMKQQVDTLAQLALAQKEETEQARTVKEQEAALDKELSALKKEYGEFPEQEVLMRMTHMDMTAAEAYADFQNVVGGLKSKPSAPFVLGGGGPIPQPQLDVKKMDRKDTKSLVAQMLEHSQER